MSTSPSWFDQEKFSRLVKKVGPKAGPVSTPSSVARPTVARSPEKETKRLQRVVGSPVPLPPASRPQTAPIPHDPVIRATAATGEETASFPAPVPLPETRGISPLSRRTTPLPNLKSIFEYDETAPRPGSASQPLPNRPVLTPPVIIPFEGAPTGLEKEPEAGIEFAAPEGAVPSWPLPGELATPSPGGSKAVREDELENLSPQELIARLKELSQAGEERDAARHQVKMLQAQLQQADEIIQATGIPGASLEELTRTIDERDAARRDYANLREQFEEWKALGGTAGTPGNSDELAELKSHARGLENTVANLKQELSAVQGQIAQSRDQASAAQRGLALSQKALQETRDALREASEAYSLAKANVESLKNECNSLVQQNAALQAQHEQITRELEEEKSRRGTSS